MELAVNVGNTRDGDQYDLIDTTLFSIAYQTGTLTVLLLMLFYWNKTNVSLWGLVLRGGGFAKNGLVLYNSV